MRIIAALLWVCLLTLPSCTSAVSQEDQAGSAGKGQTMMKFKAGEVVMLQEVGGIIDLKDGKMEVLMVPPKDRRPEGMPEVDLAIGDEVGMVNGKRITAIKELQEAYEQTSIGSEMKIGIRRQGQAHIVSFVKKDPKDMPKGKQMIIRRGQSDENSDFFPALGIGIMKKGEDIIVSETLSHAPKNMTKGDIIKRLNGMKIDSIEDFNHEFDKTEIGAMLTFELLRDGKTFTVTAPRPEPKQQTNIQVK